MVVMELDEERMCKVDRQKEGLVVFIMTGSLNHHLNHQREVEASQCPRGLVSDLVDHRILDLYWSFKHTLGNAAHQRAHVLL